jgi:hypothetical protein
MFLLAGMDQLHGQVIKNTAGNLSFYNHNEQVFAQGF